MDKSAIRDAATIVVVRRGDTPAVLMGQRGANAAFMPSKYVFPGGAVDDVDAHVPMAKPVPDPEAEALSRESKRTPNALIAAAIRELWEETGQQIGQPGAWPDPPKGWRGFAGTGLLPDPSRMKFFFRAVTPEGRPRRFDARFFLLDAAFLTTDPDDFSRAEDELSHLHWVPMPEVRALDLPFITEVVLAEVAALLRNEDQRRTIPFFRNDDERHLVSRLGGARPLDGL